LLTLLLAYNPLDDILICFMYDLALELFSPPDSFQANNYNIFGTIFAKFLGLV